MKAKFDVIFYVNVNYKMYIPNLYVVNISKTKERKNYYNKNLMSAISKRRQELKTLTKEHSVVKKAKTFYHIDRKSFG